jgi:hypothetical protein
MPSASTHTPCRYAMREIVRMGEVVGYAVHQSWHEDGQLRSQVIRSFSPLAEWNLGSQGRPPADLFTAYQCAKGMTEALNG